MQDFVGLHDGEHYLVSRLRGRVEYELKLPLLSEISIDLSRYVGVIDERLCGHVRLGEQMAQDAGR
ncbi:hypothetical protein D3C86_1538660 [compost metagenome]